MAQVRGGTPTMNGPDGAPVPRVLHVVVGHGLPGYFLNAVRSLRAAAPADPLLIIDNASPQAELRSELRRLADADGNAELILRSANDLRANRKVGGLYDAYKIAFDHALTRDFDLLHLVQGDFQVMWWDDDLVRKARAIFQAHPRCVNIQMQIWSRDRRLTGELQTTASGLVAMPDYGLTDTGLYHLGRWRDLDMSFGTAERSHAQRYLDEGLEVICHPWPTDAPIPWPAVVRNGAQKGREVAAGKPFLLRPLTSGQIAKLKSGADSTWLEDVCIPWGWACATPMWVSDLGSIDYWVLRYRDARANGLRHVLPRMETRGVERADRRAGLGWYRYRPSIFRLFVAVPASEGLRRLTRRG
jgi:hypothetical protein